MNTTLRIVGWNQTFENSDSRKRERLKFFYAPSGNDSRGYISLVSRFPQDKAMMAFGVFQALCQLSATLGRSTRGTFKNTDGTLMDLQQISCLLRIEICHLSAALEILTDSRVKWCEWVDVGEQSATCLPENSGFVQGQGQGQGQDMVRERDAGAPAEAPKNPENQPIEFPDFDGMPPLAFCKLAQAISYAPTLNLTADEAEFWWHTRNGTGWTKGSANGGAARKITSWQSDMAVSVSWIREEAAKAKRPIGTNGKPAKQFSGMQETIKVKHL